ncbi:MAG: response regulator transcription factor [Candidatus Obscuribacterales bacterium]|nr:response regulator transcription factor [Candidatus Obscuribacterales bacterium]
MSEQTNESVVRVLLVEDHKLTRMGLKTALKRVPDFDVIGEAANGQEAIQQAEALNPDVILMDVGMPVLDGIQAAKQIKVNSPDIQIIMLTQHDNESDIFASLAAGASGYCLKDVEPERLYMAIRSVSSGDTWLDSSIASKVLKHYSNRSATEANVAVQTEEDLKIGLAANVPSGSAAASAPTPNASTNSTASYRPLPEPLSPRELEVLQLIVDGLSNQQIAEKLIISLATAKTHVRNILNKLAVDDRTQAAVQAMRRGLV